MFMIRRTKLNASVAWNRCMSALRYRRTIVAIWCATRPNRQICDGVDFGLRLVGCCLPELAGWPFILQ